MGARSSKFFGIAAGLTLAALAAPVRAEDLRLALEASNKEFEAAASKGDGASLALLYTPDGQLLPFGSEVVSGTKQIQKFWQGVLDSGTRGVTLKTLEAEGHGTTAHEVGQYELRDPAGKLLDRGKYVVIWKRDGGKWKLHRDIWTTSLPPAKP
jgi:ketosteroid isomerase-like protein